MSSSKSYNNNGQLTDKKILDELNLKGLYNFVLLEQSNNEKIVLSIYENEKYRSVLFEWGRIRIYIHICNSCNEIISLAILYLLLYNRFSKRNSFISTLGSSSVLR